MDRPSRISVFVNGAVDRKCVVPFHNGVSVKDVISACQTSLGIPSTVKCKLYDSSGQTIDNDDLECLDPAEPLFISQGEKFVKSSSLAVYESVKLLGKGGFGTVWLYRNRLSHAKVAIKFSPMHSTQEIQRVYSEISALRGLQHPNIVELLDAFPLEDQICFVMEFCSGGELKQYLEDNGPLREGEVYRIGYQIVGAVRCCHNSKLVHRDLKLENILFSSTVRDSVKIVDFGISGAFTIGMGGETSAAGSLLYVAPEVLAKRDNRANPALDIWSVGCIFYCLLTNKHPFTAESAKEVVRKITTCEAPALPTHVTRPWHVLLTGMLQKDPNKRWSTSQVLDHLYKFKDTPCAAESLKKPVHTDAGLTRPHRKPVAHKVIT